MDTALKVVPYTDVPGCPEKGVEPLHSQPCPTSSAPPEQPQCRRSFGKRLRIACGIVALTWFVCLYGQRAFYHRLPRRYHVNDEAGRYSPPCDGDPHQCAGRTNWTTRYDDPPWASDYPHGAETAFSLPLDSDALFIISRGPLQQGLVNIEQSTEVSDVVDVRVRVAYFEEKLLDLATVCQMEKKDDEHGVGIFTPPPGPHHRPQYGPVYELKFDVTLTLPAGSEGPLPVKKLRTTLPNYSQNVADLGESVLFEQIYLTSANGKLSVESVTSEVGLFSTLNGVIDGSFNARTFLDLHVANGQIKPTVNLLHRKGADPIGLSMHVINGQIDADISLASDVQIGGEFEVDAQSNRGAVELKFADTPVDSVLLCRAETTAGPVHVELDSAFEGSYRLENLLGAKLVTQHDVEDPAGKGRRRVVTVNESRGRVEGELKWVDSDGSSSGTEGRVALKSFTSSVKLVV